MTARERQLPTGTVTFFFSDVQDSTGLLQRLGGDYRAVIERQAVIIRLALAAHNGAEVSTEGDSFFAVFAATDDAAAAAADIQQALDAEPWPDGGAVAVRIGLHAGVGELGHDNYVGIDVNRAARISAAGHGGQVVVSESVRVLASGYRFIDLGEHTLKGLDRSEHLYQLAVDGLPQTFPPLRTASQRPNNLPALASEIIGRSTEQVRLAELIEANRLVTLTGPGGVGKTRLALEVGNYVLGRFDQGVYLVDLTPIDDPELLLPAITSATGVKPAANGGLAAALSDGPRLLILDNFEQLAAAAPRVGELMAHARTLKVLATSQVPLRIGGETVVRLEPLGTRDDDSPAVALFVERARQSDASFDLDAHRDDVVRLVDVLDGVPLAIELAAARINVLTPAEILGRLDTGVLKTSRPDSPVRHRSIEAAVAWSYHLLTTHQQELLQAMSVFRGGATLAAIESVAGRDALDDLGELVDRSLVETSTGTMGKRFDLLTSVQLFAASRIANDSPFAERHTEYFVRLAADALYPLDSDASPRWRGILEDNIDNVRATLDRLLDDGDIEQGLAMLGGSWRFFQLSGRLDELDLWLRRFFVAAPGEESTRARARALMARGALHYWRSQWSEAGDDYDAALAIAETLDDADLLSDAVLGSLATRSNAIAVGIDIGDVDELFVRAKRMADESGDAVAQAFVEFHEIVTTRGQAVTDDPPGPELFERAVQLLIEAGRMLNVAHLRAAQAELLIAREDYSEAQRYALEGLDAAEHAGDVFGMSWVLSRLAITVTELSDPAMGTRIAAASEAARERSGGVIPPPFASFSDALSRSRAVLGDAADAIWEEGGEIGLIAAVEMARNAVSG